MLINYYVDRIVGVVFSLALFTMVGLYFFPETTLSTMNLVIAGVKPITTLFLALFGLVLEILQAILSVFGI